MDLFNRLTLKNFFKKGSVPTEVHFSNLIDSTVNKIDDGFSKTVDDGLKLTPGRENGRLISFYDGVKDLESTSSAWNITVNPTEASRGLSLGEKDTNGRIYFQEGGNVGVGNLSPNFDLDIAGSLASHSRIGSFNEVKHVPADGEWHILLDNLEGCQAFELVAKAQGVKKRGKYAICHAIAVSTHGNLGSKVKTTQAFYGWFWHRIKFRWKKVIDGKYRFEVRSVGHYGMDEENEVVKISCHVTSLWDQSLDKK